MPNEVETHLISRNSGKSDKAMDVKQSFQKMTDWAKKHPVLAGGIVLVIVLLAWWASKQKPSVSMSSSDEEGASDFLGASPSDPLLGFDDGKSPFEPIVENVGGITQPAPVYDAPVFENLPSIPELQSGGFFDPGSVQSTVAQTPQASSLGVAMGSIGASKVTNGATTTKVSKAVKPVLATPTATKGIISSRTPMTAPKRASTPAVVTPKAVTVSQNFTGWKNGIFYLKGIPMGWGLGLGAPSTGSIGSRTPTTTTTRPGRGSGR